MALFQPSLYWISSKDAAEWTDQAQDAITSQAFHTYLNGLVPGATDGTTVWDYTRNFSKIALALPEPLHEPIAMRINKLGLPDSIPTFKEANRRLDIIAISTTAGVNDLTFSVNMDINKRYISVAEVATDINTQLQAQSPQFSCTSDIATQKITLVSAHPDYSLRNRNANPKLGFTGPLLVFGKNVTGNAPVNLTPTMFVYVRSKSFGRTSAQISGTGDQDIVAQIPYQENVSHIGGNMYYESSKDATFINLVKRVYQQLDFELLDDDREVVRLLSQDWSMEVSFLYRR